MPTISEKIYFNFDGKNSADFNLVHINLNNSLFEDKLVANREIVETKVSGNYKPFLNRVDYNPLDFELVLAFDGFFDDRKMDEIIRWLFVDQYKPFYFYGNEGKVVYCMPSDESTITHNGLSQGYITIRMRCNSPFYYSPVILSEEYDLSLTNGKQTITLENNGHFDIYPEISITMNASGNISFVNKTNGGKIFDIRELAKSEGIYINTEKEIIESDIIGVYRYGNVFGDYPYLVYGKNTFEITGNCKIQFRYQNIYKY